MSKADKKRLFLDQIERHYGILYRICMLYAENRDDRDDLSQEILYQLWKSHDRFKGDSSFSTWMYRIALNTALMHRRKIRRLPKTDPLEKHRIYSDIPFPADEEIEALYSCIHKLPRLERAIILLKLEDKTYQEIASVIGLSANHVSVRLVRIRRKLKNCLMHKGIGEDHKS